MLFPNELTERQRKDIANAKNRAYRHANPEKQRQWLRNYRERHPIKYRQAINKNNREHGLKRHYKHAYGLSLEQYDALLAKQNGTCAICKNIDPFKKRLSVDHVTGTKIIRGLLCHRCNVALGLFQDNIDRINEAINYLRRT